MRARDAAPGAVAAPGRGLTSTGATRIIHRVCVGCGILSRELVCRHCEHTDRKYGIRITEGFRSIA